MVIVEQVIRDLLIRTNLVGTRVFLIRAPQTPAAQQTTPFIIFFHVAPLPYGSHDGPLSLLQRDYQISIFDDSQTRALAIGDSIRAALDGFRQPFEGVEFGGVFYRTQTHGYETETKLHAVIQEYRITYRLRDPQPVTRNITRSNTRSKELTS